MKARIIIRIMTLTAVLIICFSSLSVVAHAYEKIYDPKTIEKLQDAQPDEIVELIVERFNVKGEKLDSMPSWPDKIAARRELRELVGEQNNLLIEEMRQYADFEVTYIDPSIGWIQINIAAGEVEKLEAVDQIADMMIFENAVYHHCADKECSGDTDRDGELTILDATQIQRYIAKILDEAEIDLNAADFDADGEVTILDATEIQRHLAGL